MLSYHGVQNAAVREAMVDLIKVLICCRLKGNIKSGKNNPCHRLKGNNKQTGLIKSVIICGKRCTIDC